MGLFSRKPAPVPAPSPTPERVVVEVPIRAPLGFAVTTDPVQAATWGEFAGGDVTQVPGVQAWAVPLTLPLVTALVGDRVRLVEAL